MIPRIRPCLATRFSSSWNIKLRLAQSFIIIPRNCQHSSIHSYSLYTRHIRFYTLTACGQKLLSGPDRNWFTINERRMPGVYSYSRIFVHIFFPKTIWCYLFDSMFNIGWAHLGAISLRLRPLLTINTYNPRLSHIFGDLFQLKISIFIPCQSLQSTIVKPCKFHVSDNGGNNCMPTRLILITKIENNFQSLKTHFKFK